MQFKNTISNLKYFLRYYLIDQVVMGTFFGIGSFAAYVLFDQKIFRLAVKFVRNEN